MKKLNKYSLFLVAFICGVILCTSCSDMEKEYQENLVTYPEITITDFNPKSGRPSSNVTITGTNFGEYSDAAKISFNGELVATIESYTDNQMVVKVPENAGTGKISVNVWTHAKAFETDFVYLPGAIVESVNPERGSPGDTISLIGENFGDDINIVSVLIGDVEATVLSVSDTGISFLVPDVNSGTLYLYVGGQEVEVGYLLIGGVKLGGTSFGHEGSWNNNPETYFTAAFDGDINTFVDAEGAAGYAGYEMPDGRHANLTSFRYVPRATHPGRMVNGEVRGSNDPTLTEYDVLYTIMEEPPVGVFTEVQISTTENYRYIYYYDNNHCNVAELEFYGKYVD